MPWKTVETRIKHGDRAANYLLANEFGGYAVTYLPGDPTMLEIAVLAAEECQKKNAADGAEVTR